MIHKRFLVGCLLIGHTIFGLEDYTNQTYFFTRSIFDSVSMQQASWHDIAYKKQKNGCAFQVIGMYGQSFSNLDNPSYFLFDCKNKIIISGGTPSVYQVTGSGQFQELSSPAEGQIGVKTLGRDVLGQWLGITDTNTHFLTLNPEQRQACALIEINQDLNRIFNISFFENWYIDIALPVTWMENNIGMSADTTVQQAFDQADFNFVRITPCSRHSTRLTQATISLGTKYITEKDLQVVTSSGVIVPLVEQNYNRSLFEPVQGFDAHFGLDTLVHFQFPILQKAKDEFSSLLFFADIHNNFLARNHQLRTFDIKHKPFSRYMKLYDRKTNSLVPAMNVLTLRSRVEPFNIVNFSTGFRLKHHDSFGEFGYELWAHGSEVVTPEPKPDEHGLGVWYEDRYGIAFIGTDGQMATIDPLFGNIMDLPVGSIGLTASESTINYVAAPDGEISCCSLTPQFIQKNRYLRFKDLDHHVGTSRPTITHRGHINVGLGKKGKTRDMFVNAGAFIEATQNNAALCFWGAWLKAGLTF